MRLSSSLPAEVPSQAHEREAANACWRHERGDLPLECRAAILKTQRHMGPRPFGKDTETEITLFLTCSPKDMWSEVPDQDSEIYLSLPIKYRTLI